MDDAERWARPRALLSGGKALLAAGLDLAGGTLVALKRAVMPPRPLTPASVRRVLAIRLDHVGDVLMSTVFLQALKACLPEAGIEILVKPQCAPLLEGHPALARVIPFLPSWTRRPGDATGGSAPGMELAGYDLVFSLRGDLRENRLARKAGAPWRAGYAVRGGAFYLTHVAAYDLSAHQTRRDLALLRALGLQPPEPEPLRLYLTEAELTAGRELLREAGLPVEAPLVIVHPGAATALKQWGAKPMAAVARQLCARGNAVAVMAGPGEEADAEEVAAGAPAARRLPLMPLRSLAAVLAHADAVLGNDSGPMHVAMAAGTPVVAVFGPTMEEITGPLPGAGVVVSAAKSLRPRWFPGTPPPDPAACRRSFEAVEVDQVLQAVTTMLAKG